MKMKIRKAEIIIILIFYLCAVTLSKSKNFGPCPGYRQTSHPSTATQGDKSGRNTNEETTTHGNPKSSEQDTNVQPSTKGSTYSPRDHSTYSSIHPNCFESTENVEILNGSFLVNSNCTRMYNCTNGQVVVNAAYSCSANAVCEKRNDVRMCYCSYGFKGNGENCQHMTNCLDWFNAGFTTNDTYTVKPANWNGSAFNVSCNMAGAGGWTVFQRRVNGSVNFYRNWQRYKEGFGELDHEFWLGNDKLYYLTNQGKYQIRIDVVNVNGVPYFAKYDLFRINDESDNYRLSELGTYSGTSQGDNPPDSSALRFHQNYSFSTFDRDNDVKSDGNCAVLRQGAWWYRKCAQINLNGEYHTANDEYSIFWRFLPGDKYHIKYTEMKIRPV